jgi:diguanylate cyclase (GGDEF)-like protein/PAS domain S-box-containing protein
MNDARGKKPAHQGFDYSLVFEASLDGVLIASMSEEVMDANPAACALLGLERGEIVGRKLIDLFDKRDEALGDAITEFQDSRYYTGELGVRRRGEGVFRARVALTLHKKEEPSQVPQALVVRGALDSSVLKEAAEADQGWVVCVMRDVSKEARLREEMQRLATRDDLTGLYNRREMLNILAVEMARCSRYDRAASLLVIGIDHFQAVNDSYGHVTGDAVLKQLTGLVTMTVRTADVAGRLGGDEIGVILPETDQQGAIITAERIRQKVAAYLFSLAPSDERLLPVRITVSIGIAGYPDDGATAEDMLAVAGRALYAAKQHGRNRTVAFDRKAASTGALA